MLVVIGVLAAIAIPNLLGALQRARQKRTVSDMRSVGSALEAYAIDADAYPAQVAPGPVSAVASSLAPTFIVALPDLDSWRTPLRYEGAEKEYTLTSLGRDRQPGGGGAVSADGTTTDFDNDIVFGGCRFLRLLKGTQR